MQTTRMQRIKDKLNEKGLMEIRYWQAMILWSLVPAIIVGLIGMVIAQAILLKKCHCCEQLEKQRTSIQFPPTISSPSRLENQGEAESAKLVPTRCVWITSRNRSTP